MNNQAKVRAAYAKGQCEDYIAGWKRDIDEFREEAINRQMGRKHGFLNRRYYTREEAIQYLKSVPDMLPEWNLIGMRGRQWIKRAEQIIALCDKSVDGFVWIDGECVLEIFNSAQPEKEVKP